MKQNTVPVGCVLTAEEYKQFKAACDRMGTYPSAAIRDAGLPGWKGMKRMEWQTPKEETRKSYRWQCPSCFEICYYVPHGPRKEPKTCEYTFCPWCGKRITESGERK